MIYKTIKIQREQHYRSKPRVDMSDDMVRVTFVASRNEWNHLKRMMKVESPMREGGKSDD